MIEAKLLPKLQGDSFIVTVSLGKMTQKIGIYTLNMGALSLILSFHNILGTKLIIVPEIH